MIERDEREREERRREVKKDVRLRKKTEILGTKEKRGRENHGGQRRGRVRGTERQGGGAGVGGLWITRRVISVNKPPLSRRVPHLTGARPGTGRGTLAVSKCGRRREFPLAGIPNTAA